MLIDGRGVGEVGDEVLRDRRHLAVDGLGAASRGHQQTGWLARGPARDHHAWFRHRHPGDESLLADGAQMLAEMIQRTSVEERTDPGLRAGDKVRDDVRRFLRKRSGRRPLVLPVIMEI